MEHIHTKDVSDGAVGIKRAYDEACDYLQKCQDEQDNVTDELASTHSSWSANMNFLKQLRIERRITKLYKQLHSLTLVFTRVN